MFHFDQIFTANLLYLFCFSTISKLPTLILSTSTKFKTTLYLNECWKIMQEYSVETCCWSSSHCILAHSFVAVAPA